MILALYNTELLKFSKAHVFIQFLLSSYYVPETLLTRGTDTEQRKCRQGKDGKEEGGDILPIVLAGLLIEASERTEENTPEAVKAHRNIINDVSFIFIYMGNRIKDVCF